MHGNRKRNEFDVTQPTVYEAAGYKEEIMQREIEPRAALLANQIVDLAGICPTMAIEVLMDSPILKDSALDNRDRAMIILLAGPAIASVLVKQALENPGKLQSAICESKFGFDHNSGKEQHVVLGMEKAGWELLVRYAESRIFSHKQTIDLVRSLQQLLDDQKFNSLQKAVVEALVVKSSAVETARNMAPTASVVGALATVQFKGKTSR